MRRFVQIGFLILFAGANYWGWKIIQGDYSSALILNSFYLTDPFAVIQTFMAGYLVASSALMGALIIFLIYAVFFGRAFCSWICPVNMIADLSNLLHRRLKMQKSLSKVPLNRNARYWILGGFLVLSTIAGGAAFEFISPISMLYRGIIFGMGMGWLVIPFLMLLDLFIKPYAFCGHLCPLGAFYSLISRFRIIKITHHLNKCTLCNACFEVCPEKQVLQIVGKEQGFILSGECTLCGKCVDACDDDALKFSLLTIKEKSGGKQYV
ncbi:MAG: quinol dehydrogenase ferredoxin subunit NapH [Bacteroidales bacterium]|nr:quinol dehydrogenase ferredoxin subunit NapH [Bacteroidales bacterium]